MTVVNSPLSRFPSIEDVAPDILRPAFGTTERTTAVAAFSPVLAIEKAESLLKV